MDDLYLKKVRDGDKDAFRYFVEKYSQKSYSLALSLVRDPNEAEEIVHISFIKAFKALPRFREDSSFSSWLFRIVYNECQQHFRKNKRYSDEKSLEISHTEKNQEEQMIETEEIQNLKKALKKLTFKEALVIRLFYIYEMNLKEIHKITGFSSSNIKVLLFRGRKNLKELLHKQEVNQTVIIK